MRAENIDMNDLRPWRPEHRCIECDSMVSYPSNDPKDPGRRTARCPRCGHRDEDQWYVTLTHVRRATRMRALMEAWRDPPPADQGPSL